jgi:hypothetical protein
MVVLSEVYQNNYDRVLRYKNSLSDQDTSVNSESGKTCLLENSNPDDNNDKVVNQLR